MSFKDQDSKKSLGEQLHDVEFIIMDESGKTTGEVLCQAVLRIRIQVHLGLHLDPVTEEKN